MVGKLLYGNQQLAMTPQGRDRSRQTMKIFSSSQIHVREEVREGLRYGVNLHAEQKWIQSIVFALG